MTPRTGAPSPTGTSWSTRPARMRGIGHAALDVLRAEPRTDPDRIAAVGYGTGGTIALELGRTGVNLRAIGTINALTTGRPGEAARIRCPVWAGAGAGAGAGV